MQFVLEVKACMLLKFPVRFRLFCFILILESIAQVNIRVLCTNGQEEDIKKNYIVNQGSNGGESSEGKTQGADSSAGDGQDKAGRQERVTGSRGRQLGGEEEEGDREKTYIQADRPL